MDDQGVNCCIFAAIFAEVENTEGDQGPLFN